MPTVKEKAATADTAGKRDGKAVVRTARPVAGSVDYAALIKRAMKQFPKTRARLAN